MVFPDATGGVTTPDSLLFVPNWFLSLMDPDGQGTHLSELGPAFLLPGLVSGPRLPAFGFGREFISKSGLRALRVGIDPVARSVFGVLDMYSVLGLVFEVLEADCVFGMDHLH